MRRVEVEAHAGTDVRLAADFGTPVESVDSRLPERRVRFGGDGALDADPSRERSRTLEHVEPGRGRGRSGLDARHADLEAKAHARLAMRREAK